MNRTKQRRWVLVSVLTAAVGLLGGCGGSPPPATDTTVETPGGRNDATTSTEPGGDSGESTPGVEETTPESRLDDVFFDYDQYELRADTRRLLQENARYLREHSGMNIVLEGHCDERGTNEYNLALGQRRADSVRDYLIDLGIDGGRLRTISYGEERPFETGHDESAWARNRRVHFVRR